MRIVCVSPYLPYPGVDHAGGEYLLHYLDHLVSGRGWDVMLVVPGTPANRSQLARCPFNVVLHPADESPGIGRIAARLVDHGANTPRPASWLRSLPADLDQVFRSADLLDLHWSESILLAPHLRARYPGVPMVGTAYDVLTQSVTRGRGSTSPIERARALLAARAVAQAETAGIESCDLVLVFNPENEDGLRAMGVTTPVATAPAYVDLDGPNGPTAGSHRMLFTGALWRPENSEAAEWLLEEILPLVRQEIDDVTVRLAGSRPPPSLTDRAGPAVEVTGYLPDLASAYDDVGVVVSPLLRGAGLKFKVLQGMAAGYPVVATSVAAEGIAAVAGHAPAFVVDDPVGFASAIVNVLRHHDAHIAGAQQAAIEVRERVSFDARIAELVETLSRLETRPR
jgi:glycosyltransferase involved in cell wall biosynthesis